MKVNERWLATLLVAFAMGFGVAGCDGNDNPEDTDTTDDAVDSDASDDTLVPDPDVVDSPDDTTVEPDVVEDTGCTTPPTCPNAPADHEFMGQPCLSELNCGTMGLTCITESTESFDGEEYISWVGGHCILLAPAGEGCDPEVASSCPTGSRCALLFTDDSTFIEYYGCLDACSAADTSWNPYDWACGCRRGYACNINMEMCLPGCTNDRECCEVWDDLDDSGTRDAGEVLTDPDCTNTCDGNDATEYSTDCRASYDCVQNGDPDATYQSECVFDSDCPAGARCLNEIYYYDMHTGEPYYPGGLCLRDRCELVGRGCGTDLEGECVNLGSSSDPFYACWAACTVGYGPGDAENPCRDDDMDAPYTCTPYPEDYWLSPSTTGANGLCFAANITTVTTPNFGATCADDSECYSPLGLGGCYSFSEAPRMCSVQCSQELTEGAAHVCGSPATAGGVAPAVCWSGLCLPACTTPNGAVATNDCPQEMACFDNSDAAYGAYSYYDLDGTQPTGFCFTACLDNAWCQDVFGVALNCNTTTGQCGT